MPCATQNYFKVSYWPSSLLVLVYTRPHTFITTTPSLLILTHPTSSKIAPASWTSSLIIKDSVEDIKTCQEIGISGQQQCIDTVISTGEHCVYCTKDSPDDPDDRSACLTPTLAQEAKNMFRRDGIRCSEQVTEITYM